ncbi:PRC-barrel domain containing protein [Streptacidiphilus sp. P02-A3a]|uniref:PRC-barrel domain containing protein n=1 Tax=Streptacidiphilus sp. P02-A3a TaxID=2704468 RepID=UPI00351A8975
MENVCGVTRRAPATRPATDLTGYRVEASDGHIGKVDEHSQEAGAGYLIVDTGPWIFGKQVMLPVGTITRIDPPTDRPRGTHQGRDQGLPRVRPDHAHGDVEYQQLVGGYYGMWPI